MFSMDSVVGPSSAAMSEVSKNPAKQEKSAKKEKKDKKRKREEKGAAETSKPGSEAGLSLFGAKKDEQLDDLFGKSVGQAARLRVTLC